MIRLTQVIHDTKTNSVEATWANGDGVQVKCHSYADVQMSMLEADLGADLQEYASLIATVRAGIVPYVAPRKTYAEVAAAIKRERDYRKNGGVLVSGKWYHSDSDSRIQQLGLIMMGAGIPPVQWKTLDGSFVTMSQTLAGGIFRSVASLDMAIFAAAESHMSAVRLLADPTNYDYSTGWPATFVSA